MFSKETGEVARSAERGQYFLIFVHFSAVNKIMDFLLMSILILCSAYFEEMVI